MLTERGCGRFGGQRAECERSTLATTRVVILEHFFYLPK